MCIRDSEGIDYITQFYINFAMGLDLSADEKNTLIKSLEDYKRFLYTPDLYNELFVSEESKGLYFESITQAHNLGIIDDFEFNKMCIRDRLYIAIWASSWATP